jgi:hypothetical protein
MCVHIQYVNKNAQGTITSVGGDGVGWPFARPWRLSVADTLALISRGWIFFTTNPAGGQRVLVRATANGSELRTFPDSTVDNNLQWLPPGGGPLGTQPGWPEAPHTAVPVLVDVRRASSTVPALGKAPSSYSVQPAAGVRINFSAPWPALLEVSLRADTSTWTTITQASTPDLWQAMLKWHSDLHFGVGGAMKDLHTSPAALIFWPWHAYVDNVYWDWSIAPATAENPSRGRGREHQGPGCAGGACGQGKTQARANRGRVHRPWVLSAYVDGAYWFDRLTNQPWWGARSASTVGSRTVH